MKGLFGIVAAGVLLAGSPELPAWAASHSPLTEADKKVKREGFAALTHFRTRVYGYFFNRNDFYYYRGTHADLQEFLLLLAKVEVVKQKSVLVRPGRGRYQVIAAPGKGGAADWMIQTSPDGKGVELALTIWSGGHIDPAKLKFPEGLKVTTIAEG